MVWKKPTYRLVDGGRVDGAWCHVWVTGYSGYSVDDLFVFADGSIRCGKTFDLEGLRQRLDAGKVALRDPECSVPERLEQTPRWSARYPEPLTNEGFLGEAGDEIEALNGRPTTSDLCWEAIRHYQWEPAEDNRLLVREAYLAIPPHKRVFVLGDMDRQDITAEMHHQVLEYFNAGDRGVEQSREHYAVLHADDPVKAGAAAITLHERGNPPTEPPEHLDLWVLTRFPRYAYAGSHPPPRRALDGRTDERAPRVTAPDVADDRRTRVLPGR